MSGTDLKTISEMSGLPFYDIKFIAFLLLISALFAVLFFGLLKKLIKWRETKELFMFEKFFDDFHLTDTERKFVKIFTIVRACYDGRYSAFLGFYLKDTLSIQDKELLENFERQDKIFPFFSDDYKNFKLQHNKEYKIFQKLYKKFSLRNACNVFMIVGLLLLFLLVLVGVLCLLIPFLLK